jgi:hypothetical protein
LIPDLSFFKTQSVPFAELKRKSVMSRRYFMVKI